MALFVSNTAIWEEIERSESYLVCCLFEEAASMASSVLRRLCETYYPKTVEDVQLNDMMESAGMVLVQSLKELGRTSEILSELKILFGSVTAIPVQVLLAGACFQISEGSSSGLQELLEEFLSKWRYVDGQSYILTSVEASGANMKGFDGNYVLGVEEYLGVVELYTVTLLGMVSNDMDLAISWVEKAELPEEKRQELLRRLCSLYSLKATSSSHGVVTPLLADKNEAHAASGEESNIPRVGGFSRASNARYPPNGGNDTKKTISKFSEQIDPFFWWFRTIHLKFANACLLISHGKIALFCSVVFFIYHVFLKKRAILKRIVTRKAFSVKKALVDMWQLAFSVQVNPLAAVQPLPVATRGSR